MAVTQPRERTATPSDAKGPKRFTLDLPLLSIQVRPPDVRLPRVEMPHVSRQEIGHYADAARTFLPPPDRIAYYGALGALAVFGVVDWPVAAAIGVGTVIAQRRRREPSAAGSPGETSAPAREPEADTRATPSTRRRAAKPSAATSRSKASGTTSRGKSPATKG